MAVVDVETTRYLGCTFEIRETEIVVRAADGRLIDRVKTVSTARRVARGYRKAGR
jgi:hypothetical protein